MATRERVPHRYGPRGGVNVKAPNKMMNAVRHARGDDGSINWAALTSACGTSLAELAKWEGHNNGICVKFACGECRDATCRADHCCHWDCPPGWMEATAEKLKRGVAKMREEEAARDSGGDEG